MKIDWNNTIVWRIFRNKLPYLIKYKYLCINQISKIKTLSENNAYNNVFLRQDGIPKERHKSHKRKAHGVDNLKITKA